MQNTEKTVKPEPKIYTKKEASELLRVYTNKEASQFLRISEVTLWRERKAGRITFRRVASKIVYLQEDLEKYLEQNKRDAFAAK